MSKGPRGGYNMGGMNRNQMMAQARTMQDMILAAVNDALEQAESATEKAMSAVTGGLNIPGLF